MVAICELRVTAPIRLSAVARPPDLSVIVHHRRINNLRILQRIRHFNAPAPGSCMSGGFPGFPSIGRVVGLAVTKTASDCVLAAGGTEVDISRGNGRHVIPGDAVWIVAPPDT